jgi:hypothetical protein
MLNVQAVQEIVFEMWYYKVIMICGRKCYKSEKAEIVYQEE